MWSLEGTTAHLQAGSLVASLDIGRPTLGVSGIRAGFRQETLVSIDAARILRIDARDEVGHHETVQDSYVRGDDLVATYAPSRADEVSPQIYWRLLRPTTVAAIGLELIVSVQTSQLDGDPSSLVTSDLCVESVSCLRGDASNDFESLVIPARAREIELPEDASGAFLYRLKGDQFSYIEMVHPADFCCAALTVQDSASRSIRSCSQLFSERLEKGVIRRGRLRALFLPRDGDNESAAALYREFVATDPPLTA